MRYAAVAIEKYHRPWMFSRQFSQGDVSVFLPRGNLHRTMDLKDEGEYLRISEVVISSYRE